MSHVADAGEGLTTEPIRADGAEVLELDELACREALAHDVHISQLHRISGKIATISLVALVARFNRRRTATSTIIDGEQQQT